MTAGTAIDENGEKVRYLNRFDHIWTEILILIVAAIVYGGIYGFRVITGIAETAGAVQEEMLGIRLTTILRYGIFALYGVYLSLSAGTVWYRFVRRLKSGNIWEDSLLHHVCAGIAKAARYIF